MRDNKHYLIDDIDGSVIIRFHRMYKKTENGCWEWSGLLKHGYGVITYYSQSFGAHRVSYFIHTGKVPSLHILHKCDNPKCVNPNHLYEGTDADNTNDKVIRNRHKWTSKLKSDEVLEIRRLHREGWVLSALAKEFQCSDGNIHAIVNRDTWKHLPESTLQKSQPK